MFVGEAPGADEDARGEPFVGRAGQLLTDIIERGMGISRADVYICNVIKCRPPDNRNPEPDEVAACEPFLFRQIDLVRPRAIVGLGTFAVQAVLKVKIPISKLRGNWQDFRGIRFMPTFHPAYLLRTPERQAAGVGGYSGSDEISRDADSAPRRFRVVSARLRFVFVSRGVGDRDRHSHRERILAADAPAKSAAHSAVGRADHD